MEKKKMDHKKKSHYRNKIDALLWAFVWLIPFFAYGVAWFMVDTQVAPDILTYIDGAFSWSFIQDILDTVWQAAFGAVCPLSGFISYLVAVEVVHCMFDAMVFIPRFAHDLIERFTPGGD